MKGNGLILGLALLALGCEGELTQIMVVVDSNLASPTEIDTVEVTVTGSTQMRASGALTDAPLPRTVGVVRGGGGLGPITIRAIGLQGGTEVVEASARTSFIEGRTLTLTLFLDRACRTVTCGGEETCGGGTCTGFDVDPATLSDWTGVPPDTDGGPRCDSAPEACNGVDDDCDTRIDEDFDFTSDPSNCGRCGTGCNALPNAQGVCESSVCVLSSCDDGFDDCNGDPSDGCEASLNAPTDCGMCGVVCDVANATAGCPAGACTVGMCDDGFGDCNADATDGCETTLDALPDCGACGEMCAIANGTGGCDMGACVVASCDPGFDDCNGDPADGCETPLNTNADCGVCGTACTVVDGAGTCDTGTCEVLTCADERGDCNDDPSDGCETNTRSDDAHCGGCDMPCDPGDRCRNSACR